MPYRADGVGYQHTDTSEAAMPAEPTRLRDLVLACVRLKPATCDEVAARLNITAFSARPRLTELGNEGLIVDSGERRKLVSGKKGIVWCIAPKQMSLL